MTAAAPARPTATWREVGALFLLPFGGVVVPLVGWFAGLVCLWASDRWTTRDKLIGTVVLPGGLGPAVWLFLLAGSGSGSASSSGSGSAVSVAVVLAAVAAIVLPLASALYLFLRLRATRA